MNNQQFIKEGTCADCGREMKQTGGISHHKNPQGNYTTGYLCKRCSIGFLPQTRTINHWNIQYQTQPEPQQPLQKPKTMDTHKQMGWLALWMEDKTLRELFPHFKNLTRFADTYGYGQKHANDLKRHKQILKGDKQ